jgi:hypothetical protein
MPVVRFDGFVGVGIGCPEIETPEKGGQGNRKRDWRFAAAGTRLVFVLAGLQAAHVCSRREHGQQPYQPEPRLGLALRNSTAAGG